LIGLVLTMTAVFDISLTDLFDIGFDLVMLSGEKLDKGSL